MSFVEDTKEQVKAWQGLIGIAVASLAFLVMTQCNHPLPAPTATPQIAIVNPEVKHAKTIDVPLTTPNRTIKAYSSEAKANIALPKDVLDDAAKSVTSSSILSSSESRQVVTSVLDTQTGTTTAYVSSAADPWFATETRGQFTIDYGFKRGTQGLGVSPVGRANYRLDLIQTKRIHWGLSASAYTDGDAFVGVGGSYRW
ncbi:hypothetical protein A7981_05600 [Methylovorus sp. MM2]|uniref:hypothetical protein n=1 Tax=Methylovorus sp. MM2 TaxID=1848038 RepID=UPI0007E18AAB|nr:hypothetical protein [Methylovorus sp. MM2]OAM52911.1 hypothetical protein A7981_05600 [Methylovorus sp. MM2]